MPGHSKRFFLLFKGTGGDIYIVVTSEKENKVGAVREAFQTVFGKAMVRGMVINVYKTIIILSSILEIIHSEFKMKTTHFYTNFWNIMTIVLIISH